MCPPYLDGSRQFERYTINENIRFRPMHLEDESHSYLTDPIDAECTNASLGGMFINTTYPSHKDTPLEIRFWSANDNREIKLFGRVAWSSGNMDNCGMGIEILGLSKREFNKFLKQAGDYWNF